MKKVVVVTVNYNTGDDTRTFLHSVSQVKKSDFILETIVVDNGSADSFSFSGREEHTRLIRLEANSGFTGGYNKGIQEALKSGADYILVINNDTIIDSAMIENLLKTLESDKNIGMAVPKIYFAKGHEFHKNRYKKEELGNVIWFAGGHIDWNHVMSIHRGVDEVDHGQYDTIEKTQFATGCCMLIKREVFEKIGLFDNQYFLYYEDADLSMRVREAGYDIVYVPKAVLYHVNASSSGGAGNKLQDYFITRNQMLFGMKYAPLRTKLALLRQSMRFLFKGRPNQKKGIQDFYLRKFGKRIL